MAELKPPVLVTGVNRSGTSMTCRLLGDAPGMCLWYEPNILWRQGFAYRSHERATASDARPAITRRLRRAFLNYQEEHGGNRIVEKSPPNVLRIGYLNAVLPEARILHIYRDGRAMLRSQIEKYETFQPYQLGKDSRRHILDRLKRTPWWEWPAYWGRFADGFGRRILGKKISWFGVRYPGWKNDRGRLSRAAVVAKQWSISVETALEDLKTLPEGSSLNLRYEEVVADPVPQFRRICEFCGIDWTPEYEETVRQRVHPESLTKWKDELPAEVLEEAMPHMRDTLEKLGYLENE